MNEVLYTIISVLIVSLVSIVGIITLAMKEKWMRKMLLTLVSVSAGTLIGGAILHLLPEAIAKQGYTLGLGLVVIIGMLSFFLIERFIHIHNTCKVNGSDSSKKGHSHGHKHFPAEDYPLLHESHRKHIGVMNLLGDGLHNFGDGLIIAAAYLTNPAAGIAATIAVILHEVPQEIADFGVLLYAGFSKWKAVLFNMASAAIAIIGAIVGLVLGTTSEVFMQFILPFAAGGFLYIAGTNLFPELHKECSVKDSVIHFAAILFGVALMVLLLFMGHAH